MSSSFGNMAPLRRSLDGLNDDRHKRKLLSPSWPKSRQFPVMPEPYPRNEFKRALHPDWQKRQTRGRSSFLYPTSPGPQSGVVSSPPPTSRRSRPTASRLRSSPCPVAAATAVAFSDLSPLTPSTLPSSTFALSGTRSDRRFDQNIPAHRIPGAGVGSSGSGLVHSHVCCTVVETLGANARPGRQYASLILERKRSVRPSKYRNSEGGLMRV